MEKNKDIGTIISVKILGDATFVTFADGSQRRAIRESKDEYDLEKAILVCMAKQLASYTGVSYAKQMQIAMAKVDTRKKWDEYFAALKKEQELEGKR